MNPTSDTLVPPPSRRRRRLIVLGVVVSALGLAGYGLVAAVQTVRQATARSAMT